MKYTKYKKPCAGWQGYISTKRGTVSAWVSVDGQIVPASKIK